mgnify:CR=1 FL=1
MKTRYISWDEALGYKKDELEYAAGVLREGGLVAFPTETVYGLGGNGLMKEASVKIYEAKGRPSDNPLILHISSRQELEPIVRGITPEAEALMEAFWPGPLTMILKKKDIVPDSITGGLGTVAIRMPSHPVAARLIKTSGVYIAAPSANISGKPSPTKAEHVIHDMNGRINMIIADDTVDIGVESTIVDLSEDVPTILRPGFITKKQLEDVLGEVKVDPAVMGNVADGIVPKAPGMKYKHYSPDANVVIVTGDSDKVVGKINELCELRRKEGKRVGVMTVSEDAGCYNADKVVDMGSRCDEALAAKNLFAALRSFDEDGIQYVYSESFPTDNVGQAVMNRLIKAAGHTIIRV